MGRYIHEEPILLVENPRPGPPRDTAWIHSLPCYAVRSMLVALCSQQEINRQAFDILVDKIPYREEDVDCKVVIPVSMQHDALRSSVTHRSIARDGGDRNDSSTARRAEPTMMICTRCQKPYSPDHNNRAACFYHDGELECDFNSDEWFDWPEHVEPFDTEENKRLYPNGFVWTCCGETGSISGCTLGMHQGNLAPNPRARRSTMLEALKAEYGRERQEYPSESSARSAPPGLPPAGRRVAPQNVLPSDFPPIANSGDTRVQRRSETSTSATMTRNVPGPTSARRSKDVRRRLFLDELAARRRRMGRRRVHSRHSVF